MFETHEIKGNADDAPAVIKVPGINEWSLTDLRKCCKKNKVKGYTRMSREQLQESVHQIIRNVKEAGT